MGIAYKHKERQREREMEKVRLRVKHVGEIEDHVQCGDHYVGHT